ncbi:hypothetical protein RUM44_001886 [Polyplax serrata]|uniref:Uncharacterized protein n=1 Tax=Polyplax serrata TaxID=468196 RepID=A0ABR1ALB5_POLSC
MPLRCAVNLESSEATVVSKLLNPTSSNCAECNNQSNFTMLKLANAGKDINDRYKYHNTSADYIIRGITGKMELVEDDINPVKMVNIDL